MASLQENLQRLQEIAANPKAQLDRYLKSGRQVVGCFPIYTPEVLADAAGLVPMGMWGAQTEFSLAKKYLVPFACPIMQSCMELARSLIHILEINNGHREKTARYLNISRRTLQYKLKKYGLN